MDSNDVNLAIVMKTTSDYGQKWGACLGELIATSCNFGETI